MNVMNVVYMYLSLYACIIVMWSALDYRFDRKSRTLKEIVINNIFNGFFFTPIIFLLLLIINPEMQTFVIG